MEKGPYFLLLCDHSISRRRQTLGLRQLAAALVPAACCGTPLRMPITAAPSQSAPPARVSSKLRDAKRQRAAAVHSGGATNGAGRLTLFSARFVGQAQREKGVGAQNLTLRRWITRSIPVR